MSAAAKKLEYCPRCRAMKVCITINMDICCTQCGSVVQKKDRKQLHTDDRHMGDCPNVILG